MAILATITSPLDNDCLKYSSGNWVNSASCGGGGTPGGATNSVQYNNAGALGGILNSTATRKFVTQVSSGVPSFDTLQYGDLPVTAYAADFTSSLTWTLAGATHGLATCDLVKSFFYTSGTLRVDLQPSNVTCETAVGGTQFDVVATFAVAQAGRMELVRAGGAAAGVTIFGASAALDFGNILDGTTASLPVTVSGVVTGDIPAVGCPAAIAAGLSCTGVVTASNTVAVLVTNLSSANVDPASMTYTVRVIR